MPRSVYLAVLSYDGSIECRCTSSLLQNIRAIEALGYTVYFNSQIGNCYLPIARSKAVESFLLSDADDLVFIDSDLEFDRYTLAKLLSHDSVDVIGGVYPFKNIKKETYPVKIELLSDGTPRCQVSSGLIYAEYIPTGCMRITRKTLEKLKELHPEWEKGFDNGSKLWMVFDTGDVFNNGNWYGEDVAFCMRIKGDGMTVFVEPDIDFAHTGLQPVVGNYHKYLCSLPKV